MKYRHTFFVYFIINMKLISFDVGIKNMAYCILSIDDANALSIDDWGVLNMIDNGPHVLHTCSCMMPAKNKKTDAKICGKNAKYTKNDDYFCEKHAKSNKVFMMPTKETTPSYINKLKVDQLAALANSHFLLNQSENSVKPKKAELIQIITTFYQTNCFEHIILKKTVSANSVDLIHVGKSMKLLMNQLPNIDDITHVAIENQISPIANRMKTIQGMLAQYFIMKNDAIHIEFISSANKLKQFKDIPNASISTIDSERQSGSQRTNPNYKEHKKDAVFYSKQILAANDCICQWSDSMNIKKKDDLADCFLQGLWYLKHNNIILYAEDLKINIV